MCCFCHCTRQTRLQCLTSATHSWHLTPSAGFRFKPRYGTARYFACYKCKCKRKYKYKCKCKLASASANLQVQVQTCKCKCKLASASASESGSEIASEVVNVLNPRYVPKHVGIRLWPCCVSESKVAESVSQTQTDRQTDRYHWQDVMGWDV